MISLHLGIPGRFCTWNDMARREKDPSGKTLSPVNIHRAALRLKYTPWRAVHRPLGYLLLVLVLIHVLFVSESFRQGLPRIILLAVFAGLTLLSAKFFDAGHYPLITFESKTITDSGNGVYAVAGVLNIKGKTHDLTLPLTLAGIKDHPALPGKQVAGFNGRITLDRLSLGVGDGSFYKKGMVGKDVEVLVSLEALSPK